MGGAKSLVLQAIETYKSAVRAKDVEALMQLYDPGLRVFDTWGVWSYEGSAAWRISIEGWFSSLQGDRCEVTFDDVQIVELGAAAAMTAIVTYAGVSAGGQVLRSMQNRFSWVFGVTADGLRVVLEHTSVPIGFENNQGLLRRDYDS